MKCRDDEESWTQKTKKDSEKAITAIISRKINEKKTGKDLKKDGCRQFRIIQRHKQSEVEFGEVTQNEEEKQGTKKIEDVTIIKAKKFVNYKHRNDSKRRRTQSKKKIDTKDED